MKIKKFPYTQELGWSVSRFDKFTACKRQYYYDYYGGFDNEFGKEKIGELKKLTSLALEAGNITHDVIKTLLERLLKSEKPINRAKFLEYARNLANEYCAKKVFSEVYYKTKPSIMPQDVLVIVEPALSNVLSSKRFDWICKNAIANKDGWVIEPAGYGETRINGIKAYCKVDFLFPMQDKYYILDWKTGKKDEVKHKKQMLGYATWAAYHFDTTADKILPFVAYLIPNYQELTFTFTQNDIAEFAQRVEKEIKQLHAYCTEPASNIPLEKKEFTQTENLKICGYCNYRELCGR